MLQHCSSDYFGAQTGECSRAQTTYYISKQEVNKPNSLKRPKSDSFLSRKVYHCSYGPQDHRGCLPETATQQHRSKGSRVSKTEKGQSCKRGCLQQFTVTHLYEHVDVAQLLIRHPDHTDAAGNLVHGSGLTAEGVKHLHAPALSEDIKHWTRIQAIAHNR